MNVRLLLAVFATALLGPLPAGAETVRFGRDVTPTLYKLGCSAGQCHGAFAGRGGFRLSLFAANASADYANVRGPGGRRLNPVDPENSLLLLKATGRIGHGGGHRLATGSPEYRRIKHWIESGARYDAAADAPPISVRIEPATVTLATGSEPPALRVLARWASGKEEDVSALARFESLEPGIVTVDANGRLAPRRSGDAPVLAHYAGRIGFAIAEVPGKLPEGMAFPTEPLADPLDRLLTAKLRRLNILPAPVCTDAEFIRRAYLDVTGALPLPEEVRKFLADPAPDKRSRLIDRLLEHPLHSALWAGKLCDLAGADDRFIGNQVYTFHDWFRNKLEANLPWDQVAYGVICATTADGRTVEELREALKRQQEEAKKKKAAAKPPAKPDATPWRSGAATRRTLEVFYNNLLARQAAAPGQKAVIDARKIGLRVSHIFLGVQLECAQCHKHPTDRWTQDDFFSFAATFSFVDFGVDPALKAKGVTLNGTHVAEKPVSVLHSPRTGQPLPPRLLGGAEIVTSPDSDPREALWRWMVSAENPYFARAMVNRVWAHYFGRGLIEPVDAQSSGNPPTHPAVLDELARDFVAHKFDMRHLHRRVLNTVAYQRSWRTNATNAADERNFSHRLLRRLTAEQALDALCQVTGTAPKISKRYAQVRKVRILELAPGRLGGDDAYVLQIFGKPLRTQNCDCERSSAPSLSQALYLYNDDKLHAKIADDQGRLKKLVAEIADDRKLLEELYLSALTRLPTEVEIARSLKYIPSAGSRLEAYQDIVWSLLNRKEFFINH